MNNLILEYQLRDAVANQADVSNISVVERRKYVHFAKFSLFSASFTF